MQQSRFWRQPSGLVAERARLPVQVGGGFLRVSGGGVRLASSRGPWSCARRPPSAAAAVVAAAANQYLMSLSLQLQLPPPPRDGGLSSFLAHDRLCNYHQLSPSFRTLTDLARAKEGTLSFAPPFEGGISMSLASPGLNLFLMSPARRTLSSSHGRNYPWLSEPP